MARRKKQPRLRHLLPPPPLPPRLLKLRLLLRPPLLMPLPRPPLRLLMLPLRPLLLPPPSRKRSNCFKRQKPAFAGFFLPEENKQQTHYSS